MAVCWNAELDTSLNFSLWAQTDEFQKNPGAHRAKQASEDRTVSCLKSSTLARL
jgi:hypothetical protein